MGSEQESADSWGGEQFPGWGADLGSDLGIPRPGEESGWAGVKPGVEPSSGWDPGIRRSAGLRGGLRSCPSRRGAARLGGDAPGRPL